MGTNLIDNAYIQDGFLAIADAARLISMDVAEEVEQLLKVGKEDPLTVEEANRVLEKAVHSMRNGAVRRGDSYTLKALEGEVDQVVKRIIQTKKHNPELTQPDLGKALLLEHDGFRPRAVFPIPHLLGLDVPMWEGFVKTTDIKPWDGNPRLDIHLAQFKDKHKRDPEPDELLAIMLSEAGLPGVSKDDEFEIKTLAHDIAVNGVKVPPTLDKQGTLLDGNRRVTACYYILARDGFTAEQKQRARFTFLRQLSGTTHESHRQAVIIANNFPPDYRQPWPYYVKARKMYDAWQDMLAAEFRPPSNLRKNQMRKELAAKFAVDASVVKRYIEMVELANDFEHHQVVERKKDEHIVKHHANERFQYFDELNKGVNPGGVFYTLNQDEHFKHLVFDLLFDGKFNNWRDIRALRYVHENPEAMELMKKARIEPSEEDGKDLVGKACLIAQVKDAGNRSLGANTRIEVFTKWLNEVPVASFSDEQIISTISLKRLHECFKIVENQVVPILKEHGAFSK